MFNYRMLTLMLFISSLLTSAFAKSNIVKRDQKLLIEAVTTLNHLENSFEEKLEPIFLKLEADRYAVLTKSERDTINYFWVKFVDQRIALHTIYNTYEGAHFTQENQEAILLLKYSALLHLTFRGAELSSRLWHNKTAHKLLNEEFSGKVPRGSYISMENEIFKQYSLNEEVQKLPTHFPRYQYLAVFSKYNAIDKSEFLNDSQSLRIRDLNTQIEDSFREKYVPFLENYSNQSTVGTRWFVYKFKNIFYTIMKSISTWLGDTKVRRRNSDYYNGQTLINIPMAKKMKAKLQPGDIMLSRTNWFLSNAFLPGFWPHSFTYTGTQEEIINYFDKDAQTQYFIEEQCFKEALNCKTLSEYLKFSTKTKKAWLKLGIKDKYGFDKILIEATSDGVHFSSLRHTFLNDYLAALRPRLSKKDKAMAIIDLFSQHGKEYDFDFDYQTDDRLVCSELMAKSYASDKAYNKNGVDFYYDLNEEKYLQKYLGRLSLPVIGVVQKYYDENVLNLREPQLDFIAFLKGNRRLDNSSFSTEEDFYSSKDWKKWSFLQN